MKIDRVPDLIRTAYRADLPVLLSGRHGIGKSTLFEQVAANLGIGCRVLDLSLMEPVDLLGLPQVTDGRVVYAPPAILPDEGCGLLLLEELNRASAMTRTPALELLTRRRLHEYALPPGGLPCASINPSGDGYAVDALDPALLSRFVVVDVEPNRDQWLEWARERGLHPSVVDYVDAAPDLFESEHANPRALEYASRWLVALQAVDPGAPGNVDMLTAGLAGLLRDTIATALVRFVTQSTTPPKPDDILGDYDIVRPSVQQWARSGRLDLLQDTLRRLQHALEQQKAWNAVQADRRQAENLKKFLNDMPPDLHAKFDAWTEDRGYRKAKARR